MIPVITLLPHYPVIVVSKNYALGQAIMVTDYGPETHRLWTVVLDTSGEVWDVPNPDLRFQKNYSLGRLLNITT